jgi:hypothetical protein
MLGVPAWAKNYSLRQNIQTGPHDHPASPSMGTGQKAAGACS